MRPEAQFQRYVKRSGDGEVEVMLPIGARSVQYFYEGSDSTQVMRRADFDKLYVLKGSPRAPFRATTLASIPDADAERIGNTTARPVPVDDNAPAFEAARDERPRVEGSPGALTAMYGEEIIQAIRDAADRIVVALRELQAVNMARELARDEPPATPPPANTDRDVTPAPPPPPDAPDEP